MKIIYKLLFVLGICGIFSACNKLNPLPTFKEKDAFASFTIQNISCQEDAGIIKIPVLISSIKPLKTDVTYKIVPADKDAMDFEAKEGVNFEFADKSGVLHFDGAERVNEIEIKINNIKGFTGNKRFEIQLVSATGLKLGTERICQIEIQDLDHPLSPLFGTWTAKGDVYGAFLADYVGSQSWNVQIEKNGESLNTVRIKGLGVLLSSVDVLAQLDNSFVGNVELGEDGKEIKGINIPVGQKAPDKFNDNDIVIGLYDKDTDTFNPNSGSIHITFDGSKLTVDNAYGVDLGGKFGIISKQGNVVLSDKK